MHRSERIRPIVALFGAIAVVLSACGAPTAPSGAASIGTFELDLFVADGSTASATGPVLEDGVAYQVEVQGTYSIWGSTLWSAGSCGGAPEDEPMFPSPGGANGTVGVDAGFYFAVPDGSALCSGPVPRASNSLDFSVDGGATYADPEPIGAPTAPDPDHTYRFALVGQGLPVQVKREDSPSDDNYGRLQLEVFRQP